MMSTLRGRTRVELRMRLLSAAIGIPVLAMVVWVGGYVLAAVAALAALLALNEAMRLVEGAGWPPIDWVGIVWGVALVSVAAIGGYWVVWLLIAGAIPALIVAFALRRSPEAFADFAFTLLPMAYVALPLASVVLLRDGPGGVQWLVLAFGATFATDTGAYFIGRRFGKRKLAPSISPGKTWEGAIGGFVAAVVATLVLAALFGGVTLNGLESLVLGVLIGVLAQAGDLFESKVKRLAGVKDSGVFLPGHGGILDRLDSLLVVFPLVYMASRLS